MKTIKKFIPLIIFLLISFSAGFIGQVLAGASSFGAYKELNRPSFAPPGWVFGPAWTILYALIGISIFLIWRERKTKNIKPAIILFAVQFILNAVWTPIFFGRGERLAAFFIILALLVFIFACIIVFYRIKKISAYLFVPYFLWVCFASLLNYYVWLLNV